jgi:hypothetical protein
LKEEYRKSIENPEDFWVGIAGEFTWRRKWDRVLDWNFNNFDNYTDLQNYYFVIELQKIYA